MIYLDHNATSPLRPGVAVAMARAFEELVGNPSSVHAAGRRARAALETARASVARLVGAVREVPVEVGDDPHDRRGRGIDGNT